MTIPCPQVVCRMRILSVARWSFQGRKVLTEDFRSGPRGHEPGHDIPIATGSKIPRFRRSGAEMVEPIGSFRDYSQAEPAIILPKHQCLGVVRSVEQIDAQPRKAS